jgi:beta-glucosidase
MEGAGEDPYLGSVIAAARVRGFQGKGLGNIDAVMACAKHFARMVLRSAAVTITLLI